MHDPLRATPWTAARKDGGKSALYQALVEELDALLRGESDPVANAANAAAAIYHSLPELNWAGFYFLRGEELVVGPFQGKPACVRIALGKGVCGTAADGLRAHCAGQGRLRHRGGGAPVRAGSRRARVSRPYRVRR